MIDGGAATPTQEVITTLLEPAIRAVAAIGAGLEPDDKDITSCPGAVQVLLNTQFRWAQREPSGLADAADEIMTATAFGSSHHANLLRLCAKALGSTSYSASLQRAARALDEVSNAALTWTVCGQGRPPETLPEHIYLEECRMWFQVVAPMRLDSHVAAPAAVVRSVLFAIATEVMLNEPHGAWLHGSVCDAAHARLEVARLAHLAESSQDAVVDVLAFLEARRLIQRTEGHFYHLTLPRNRGLLADIDTTPYWDDPPPIEIHAPEELPERSALYRWFDVDDRLLYIGISKALARRQDQHSAYSSWAKFAARSTVAWRPSRREAEASEVAAIKAEHPLFNRQHNDTPEARQRLVAYLVEKGRADLLAPAVSRG